MLVKEQKTLQATSGLQVLSTSQEQNSIKVMAYNLFRIALVGRGRYILIASLSLNFLLALILLRQHSSYMKQIKEDSKGRIQKRESFYGPLKKQEISKSKKISCYVFVLILTTYKSLDRRDAIRKTWLNFAVAPRFKVIHKFVLGKQDLDAREIEKLDAENRENEDLLFLDDLKDSYQNLTLKVLRSFKWINENVDCKFVMKVDDDSFVRLAKLLEDLEQREKYGRIYWGFFRGDANVKTHGPWAEPNWVLCDKYLPYANGGGYVLSQDLVNYISAQSSMLQCFNSEDVSVGTWLAPVLLNRYHDIRFDTEYKSRGCNNQHIVSHKQTIDDMKSKYHELTINNRLCKLEATERLSFDYDWKAKPSQCCKRIPGIL